VIRIADGVSVVGLSQAAVVGLQVVAGVFAARNVDCVVTAAVTGQEPLGEDHAKGNAIDISLEDIMDSAMRERIAEICVRGLGTLFYLSLHNGRQDGDYPHLHIAVRG